MKFKVINTCVGFLNRYWKKGEIVESNNFPKWPENVAEVPYHIVPVDNSGNEIAVGKEESSTFSMSDLAKNNATPPETANNNKQTASTGTKKKATKKK